MSLHPDSLPPPYQAIETLVARHSARVEGVVRSVRRRQTSGGFWAIDVALADPTGQVTLEFLGRPEIPELAPGTRVIAQGVPLERAGGLVMVNPWYACAKGGEAGSA